MTVKLVIPISSIIDVRETAGRLECRDHVLIFKPGFKTQFSQVYSSDDENLETDGQFGVTRALVGNYVLHDNDPAPSPDVKGRWYSLDHTFVVEPGEAKLPRPPITGKSTDERPELVVLKRS